MKFYLAIDIGASSGRHIIGYKKEGEILTDEVYRFPNSIVNENGSLTWDLERLVKEIKEGIKIALKKYPKIESLSIDTWGVDYVLLNGQEEILPCFAYRDNRTKLSAKKVHEIIPFNELYKKTGIEFNEFNSIYQLYDDKLKGRIDLATDFLMMPEYLAYKLTGVKKKEYTIGSTTGLINVLTHDFDLDIIKSLKLKQKIFKKLYQPGEFVGNLTSEIEREVGGNIKVRFCAGHDTASAVCSLDMAPFSAYLSSGTWSILGVKSAVAITDKGVNLSNEGGVNNTFRHQKNIMGMWIVNKLQESLETKLSVIQMVEIAKTSNYTETFDVNDESLVAPNNMKEAIKNLLKDNPPEEEKDIINSVYHSLAKCYAVTIKEIENNINEKIENLYIVGGGAKNNYLNALTHKYSGKNIVALPIEATAIGNLKIQMEA